MAAEFHHLIVTAPNEKIAKVYEQMVDDLKATSCKAYLRNTLVYCVADPIGVRVGSGGGTLNALDHVDKIIGRNKLVTDKIVIIHSGGDSRRAPLQSVCGKAWASINTAGQVSSPMALLVHELSLFCSNLPTGGAVVIASSDVLLDIASNSAEVVFPSDAISVVGVKEIPEVAKNHGVLVSTHDGGESGIAQHYLQKPSIKTMREMGAVRDSLVYIDTGVVVATGRAFTALVALLDNPATACCTTRVIMNSSHMHALRIELYSDMLFACRLAAGACTFDDYCFKLGAPRSAALEAIWTTLHETPLHLIAVPTGQFCHLGTSAESLEMLCCCGEEGRLGDRESGNSSSATSKLRLFSRKYGLQHNVASRSIGDTSRHRHVVTVNTLLLSYKEDEAHRASSRDGKEDRATSLVEHSILTNSFRIGQRCIVSNIGSSLGNGLIVADEVMMQQVCASRQTGCSPGDDPQNHTSHTSPAFWNGISVLLVIGIDDNVKLSYTDPAATICGGSWEALFAAVGLGPDDIWPSHLQAEDKTLWNAQLYCEFDSAAEISAVTRVALTWLQALGSKHLFASSRTPSIATALGHPQTLVDSAVSEWRTRRRVSISELLQDDIGDAAAIFLWRRILRVALEDGGDYGQLSMLSAQAQHGREHDTGDVVSSVFFPLCQIALEELTPRPAEGGVARFMPQISPGGDLMHDSADSDSIINLHPTRAPDFCLHSKSQRAAKFLLLWCIALCNGPLVWPETETSSNCDSAALLEVFLDCWVKVTSASADAAWLCVRYLKLAAGAQGIVWTLPALLRHVPSLPPTHHPRAMFLAAFLLRNCENGNGSPRCADGTALSAGMEAGLDLPPANIGTQIVDIGHRAAELVLQRVTVEPVGANQLEDMAQRIVNLHVQSSLASLPDMTINSDAPINPPQAHEKNYANYVLVTAPVRIDLAGGWSDTPPICYENAGAVLNVAILVDGIPPIKCLARRIRESATLLSSWYLVKDENSGKSRLQSDQVRCSSDDELLDCSKQGPCALLKAAAVALGINTEVLSCGGMEVACLSNLPAGSGMGGSSILASAVVQAMNKCMWGRPLEANELIYRVLQVEQILTTGGGWQDQIGGIYGGFKIGRSNGMLPLRVTVEPCPLNDDVIECFERRAFLVFTGQQRLAKNVLVNALRRSALTPAVSDSTTFRLATEAEQCFSSLLAAHKNNAIASGISNADEIVDTLCDTLNSYWSLKKEMAAGTEPDHIARLLDVIRPLSRGMSLCGAGGGGYAVVILKRGHSHSAGRMELESKLHLISHARGESVSVHAVKVDRDGVVVRELDDGDNRCLRDILGGE